MCSVNLITSHIMPSLLNSSSVHKLEEEELRGCMCFLVINHYYILFTDYCHMISRKLTLRIHFDEQDLKKTSWRWSSCLSLKYALVWKRHPPNKLRSLGWDILDLVKGQCEIYRPELILRKSQVARLMKSLTHLIYQRVSAM